MTATNRSAKSVIPLFARFAPILCAGLVACASSQPVRAAKADFNGGWSVEWCDKSNPELDCGGFNITLVQDGDRICGDFGNALVNLRQTDEGSIIGTAVGSTAVLAVESYRNGSIVLVRAQLTGDELRWSIVDEIKDSDSSDIDIVTANETLKKDEDTRKINTHSKGTQTCDSFLGRSGD